MQFSEPGRRAVAERAGEGLHARVTDAVELKIDRLQSRQLRQSPGKRSCAFTTNLVIPVVITDIIVLKGYKK